MEDEANASLTCLSRCPDYARNRILALEGELESTRRESAAHILHLVAEKAAIHSEAATLRGILETRQERPSDWAACETSVLSEKQGSLEHSQNEALQTKCTSRSAQVKQSTQLAARTLREELGKIRAESRKLTSELDIVKRMYDELKVANEAGSAQRATLAEANDAAMTALQAENAAWRKAKAKYKEVKQDKLALGQTCRELLELVEIMQQEANVLRSDTVRAARRSLRGKGSIAVYPTPARFLSLKTTDVHCENDGDMVYEPTSCREQEQRTSQEEAESDPGSAQSVVDTLEAAVAATPGPNGSFSPVHDIAQNAANSSSEPLAKRLKSDENTIGTPSQPDAAAEEGRAGLGKRRARRGTRAGRLVQEQKLAKGERRAAAHAAGMSVAE
ncbi:hypothetical protein C8R47DRAFT_1074416 [Mycena vitilis]|nr:hypothetical protein C8R47DRAFT_1074416 [Mycena vitilis]